jgi:regulator of chromosome condensation
LSKIKIVQVSCGNDHVLALSSTGEVWVWGNGSSRQLGRRIIERRKLNGLEPERLGLRRITHVNAGKHHSFALDSAGTVWAWGLNGNRQCGISTDRSEAHEDLITVPTPVDGLHPDQHDGHRVVQISGGEFHSLFLFDNGEVWGCGRNDAHELGLSDDHPAQDDVRERTNEIHAEKQKVIDDAQRALDKVTQSGDEDAIAEATTALQGAQSALRIAPVEWIPEPVRASPRSVWMQAMRLTTRSTSHLSQNRTRSSRKCQQSANLPITPSSRFQPVPVTRWPSLSPDTPTPGV